jgi:hypothetical protein
MIASMKENGGYGRRIEDQFAVGVFDTILIPVGLPVFMAEVKVVRSDTFGPTERQLIELMRVKAAATNAGHVIPIVIGFKEGIHYFHHPEEVIHTRNCFSVTTSDMDFYHQLVQYYHSRKGLT